MIRKPSRRLRAASFTAVLVALVACGVPGTPAQEPSKQPNFLFIMGDDIGLETLGCYGGESYRTPRLDALARTGMRFEHCYSMPVCHPSRVCLLTGKYPFRMGRPRWGDFPKAEEKNTFAHLLKKSGYATAVAGKWQLTLMKNNLDHAKTLGFDDSSLFGWHEGPRYYDPMIYQNGKVREDTKGKYGPDVYVDFLIDFMERNRDRPFMAYYPMALCHDVTDDLKAPVPHGPKDRYDDYKEMVEGMDRCVGRLVDALDRLKLREKTLILFTGDNGTPGSYIAKADENGKLVRLPITSRRNGRDVKGGKGRLTDAGTRVPTIAAWAGVIKGGQIVDDLIDFSDFLPTFAELAGAAVPEGSGIDGRSFAPRLLGTGSHARSWAFAQHRGTYWVRTQRWKLYEDGRLIDAATDPLEKKPLGPDTLTEEMAEARLALLSVQKKLRFRK